MTTIQKILADWDKLRVCDLGGLIMIAGCYRGVEHSGARADGVALALDLARIAKGQAAPEPVAAPMPQAVLEVEPEPQPATPAPAAPTPVSFEALASAGTMLIEDELQIRRGLATARIGDYADELIRAAVDPSRRQSIAAEMGVIWNKRQLGIELSGAEVETEAWHEALTQWEGRVRAFERQMRDAVRHAGLDMLREFDVEGAGWPV